MNQSIVMQVQRKQQKQLLAKENVVSVGTGFKYVNGQRTDEIALIVGVQEKKPVSRSNLIPQTLEGIQTDVIQVGKIRAFSDPKDKFRPIQPGISIGHYLVTAGTFGCVVQRNGKRYILGNNHVLAACFDEETEVLTEDGFKKWNDIGENDKFATLNTSNNRLEYQSPSALHKYYYNDNMVHFKGKSIDCMVTPNHRMWAKQTYKSGLPTHCRKRDFEFITAGEIASIMNNKKSVSFEFSDKSEWHCLSVDEIKIPKITYNKGKDRNINSFPADKWLEFLGWYLADGSYTRNKSNGAYIISIRSTKPKNIQHLRSLLKGLGLSPQILKCGAVQVNSKQLFFYLGKLGRSGTKYVPNDIKKLHPDNLKLFLHGYICGDGFSMKANQIGAVSKSKRLSDDIQEIMFKLGMSVRQSVVKGSGFNKNGIYFRVDTRKRSSLRLQSTPKLVPYSGHVYCATVPNGTLLTRRNGYLVWSGNSNDAQIGDAIYQPGTYDGGKAADQVATLADFVPLDFGGAGSGDDGEDPGSCSIAKKTAGVANFFAKLIGSKHRLISVQKTEVQTKSANKVDAALAEPSVEMIDDILDIGTPAGIKEGKLGMEVQKMGRTTGYTKNTITQINATVYVSYGPGRVGMFTGQMIAGAMSAGGDSGSSILDMNNNIVGLLYAGSENTTIMNPIQEVFSSLSVSL